MLRNISFNLLVIAAILMIVPSAYSQKLTDVEKKGIIHIYEVEKVARDVYQILFEKWGTPVLKVISQSEQSHMDIMKELIDKYNLDDPAEGRGYGEFSTSELQKLYNDLVGLGVTSAVDALSTSAMIEEFDIVEIRKYINETDRADIIAAYNKLIEGSESHVLAFVFRLKDKSVEYKPQYLSQQDYDKIIATNITAVTKPITSVSTGTTFGELALNGKISYRNNCFNCHGDSLSTGSASYNTLTNHQNAQNLLEIIAEMPHTSGEQEQWGVLSYLLLEHDWVSKTTIFSVENLPQISLSK